MLIFIYILSDPRTNQVRYVGKTNSPTTRLVAHCSDGTLSEKTVWLADLKRNDLKPVMEIVEEFSDGDRDWQAVERFWISYWRFLGAALTNSAPGNKTPIKETPKDRALRREMGTVDNAHTIITEHLFNHGNGVFSSSASGISVI